MKKILLLVVILSFGPVITGCGYTTKSSLASHMKTIYIKPIVNKISYATEGTSRNIYVPLLEVDIHKALTDRFLFDGNLKTEEAGDADLTLKGELINYDRRVLRYTDNDDVQEYRIYLNVSLTLIDNRSGEILWQEPDFTGESTYFVSGSLAKTEDEAIDDAIADLARRIVERTVEDW